MPISLVRADDGSKFVVGAPAERECAILTVTGGHSRSLENPR